MKKYSIYILLSAVVLLGILPIANAQDKKNTFSTEGWWKPAEPPFSPVVHDDNSITFRVKAPKAKKVELHFDEWDVAHQKMKKDDKGVWSITIQPVPPRVYQYTFSIDGIQTVDFANPVVKAGTSVYGSVVEVHGTPGRYDELQNVPHGEVHAIRYTSTPLNKPREMYVYVPASYERQRNRTFPVLYLRHGGGDAESSWIKDGRAATILDNLIASGKAEPMLVVMTNGLTDGSWAGGSTVEGMDILERELLTDVIPTVEHRYRVKSGKANRAIAGLSMGGGQAYVIGLRNLDTFSYIGQFSAGIVSDGKFSHDKYTPGVMNDPAAINRKLQLLWISCGTKDPRYVGHLSFVEDLKKRGVSCEFHDLAYGHEWEFWRQQLRDFAQKLFKSQPLELSMVDPLATTETKALYANLWKMQEKGVMFGHHDYPSYGIGWRGDKDRSDVKDITGDHPAVYSLDMNHINDTKIEHIKAAHRRGGISMLVWHQNNPLTEGPDAKYPVGTSWDNTRVVDRILTEGSVMNLKYKKILDDVADALHRMKDDNGKLIPVIFRPLHEHTQTWNWWGSKATTEEEFISFWRFIVHHLRDVRGVHNVIYAISPQMDEVYGDARKRLLYRWPGDNYVDFLGMDCYHGRNTKAFVSNLQALSELSAELRKPVGVTETGLENNHTTDYWTKDVLTPLKHANVSLVVAWRNDNPKHAYGPYPSDASADDFTTFYKDGFTMFEKDLPDMYRMPEGITVKPSFVKVDKGHFTVGGKPYYYIGTNYWYGAILGSTGRGGDRRRLLRELDLMKENGIDNLRILVGADGEDGVPFRVMPTLQKEPGVYNDTIFDGLDFLLAEMDKRQMRAVLYMNNSWEWSGGYSKYLNWTGHGKEPLPGIDGWDAFGSYVGKYAECDECHRLFLNHVKHIVGRTNRYTNKKYMDDTAIMAWQVGNEPRAFSDRAKPAFAKWLKETTRLIRSIDPNHLISIGSEGKMGCENDMKLFEEIHSDANVDYLTIHIWPKNWRWLQVDSIPQTVDRAIGRTNSYINEHIAIADKLSKPIVLEEFGLPRDHHKYTRKDPTTARDKYYANAFEQVLKASRELSTFAGCNFWAWGGLGRPQHEFWKPWDQFVGDPGQEEQGLNSVFDTDTTIGVIRYYNEAINNRKKTER